MFDDGNLPQMINLTSRIKKTVQIVKDSFVVVVRYDGDYYPGLVEEVVETEFRVSVLHKLRAGWCWPKLKDSVWHSPTDVIKQVKNPLPVNSRGIFMFSEDISGSND